MKSKIKSFSPGFVIDFFSIGHERTLKAKRNIFALFLIKGVSVAVYLALVPVTIRYVNATNYGIWLTLASIVSWASFFDLGFGNGLRNRFTEAVSSGNHELARIYVSTTYAILSMIIGAVFLLFLFINTWLDWAKILNAPSELATGLNLLAIIVFAFFSIQFVFQLIGTILTANQQPALAGLLNLAGSLLSLMLIVILMNLTEGNLILLGIVMGGTPVLILLFSSIWFFHRNYAKYRPSFAFVKFSHSKDLMNLGIQFFIIQATMIVMFTTSNLIIAQLFGSAEVTVYNIALKYFSIPITLFGIFLLPFWSAFTEAWARSEMRWIKRSMKILLMIWILTSGFTVLMIVIAAPVYRLWVGENITVPFGLTFFMGIFAIVSNWNNVFAYFLNGIGKIRIQLFSSVITGALAIPIMIILGKEMGIKGVIMGTCIVMLFNGFWVTLQGWKIIRGTASGLWMK